MNCPECDSTMTYEESTRSNYKSNRADKGQWTGDIYWCHKCESHYLDDFLEGMVRMFTY
jgi:primosomal protein N'